MDPSTLMGPPAEAGTVTIGAVAPAAPVLAEEPPRPDCATLDQVTEGLKDQTAAVVASLNNETDALAGRLDQIEQMLVLSMGTSLLLAFVWLVAVIVRALRSRRGVSTFME